MRVFHPNNLDIFLYHPRLSHGGDDERFYGFYIISGQACNLSYVFSHNSYIGKDKKKNRNRNGFSLKMSKNDAITSETEASNAHDS